MFAQQVLQFYSSLSNDWNIPSPFETIFPFHESEVLRVMTSFYTKYYSDQKERIFLYGINPGRFGAGVTGISFTDPKCLEEYCGITNDFQKRSELSSQFIYNMIEAWGGPESFYEKFYITSICPIGFLKEGKNANYYDDRELEASVQQQIIDLMWQQIGFGANRKVAFSIGQGTNYKKLSYLNEQHAFFQKIIPLPHPRWVLQYRRKKLDNFVGQYLDRLSKALTL